MKYLTSILGLFLFSVHSLKVPTAQENHDYSLHQGGISGDFVVVQLHQRDVTGSTSHNIGSEKYLVSHLQEGTADSASGSSVSGTENPNITEDKPDPNADEQMKAFLESLKKLDNNGVIEVAPTAVLVQEKK